jgi:hypothetical protein
MLEHCLLLPSSIPLLLFSSIPFLGKCKPLGKAGLTMVWQVGCALQATLEDWRRLVSGLSDM